MLISAVSVLVVAQSSSEIPDGLMNNPVYVGTPEHMRINGDQKMIKCYQQWY